MKPSTSISPERMARADVCLGTDWFAGPRGKRPHPAWTRLVGLGSHLMAGMRAQPRRFGAWPAKRHRPDIKP